MVRTDFLRFPVFLFNEAAFKYAGIDGEWTGEGMDESFIAQEVETGGAETKVLAKISEEFYRPAEVMILHGDSNPIREELGWKPKYSFKELVSRMVNNDIEAL